MKYALLCLGFFFITLKSNAAVYTSTGNGDWLTPGRWSPTGPPMGGTSTDINVIIIRAGDDIEISADHISLNNVVLIIYGRLTLASNWSIPAVYGRLTINGTGSGVIMAPGGRLREDAWLGGGLQILVNGIEEWNGGGGAGNGNITASTWTSLPGGIVNPLPITLTSWNVTTSTNGKSASWTTASEKDNAYFTIEESSNGIDFSEIARIEGNVNSSVKQEYEYTFSTLATGTLYYRLKQTDLDGAYTYSSIVAVTPTTSTSEKIEWSVYPNPVTQKEFSINGAGQTVNAVSIVNPQSGREIYYQEFSATSLEVIQISLPQEIKAGMYLLNIQHTQGVESKTLMVF